LKNKSYHYTNFSKDELNDLLEQSKNGNNQSYNSLITIIREIAFSYFESKFKLGKLKSKDDADDLAQNIFITFSKQYQNIDKIEFWLRKVMFLTYSNFYKKNANQNHFEFNEEFYQTKDENDFGENVDTQKIVEIINQLDDKKQSIIKLRFWGGLKFSEIADKFESNEAAIKKMFYRTLEEIKQKF